ncbi:unnamed protein product [Rodentolepis nana]|uniref:PINc domain-containing protein n=1 Tax=Rodentolepis nana TaxID=102285 RepID=A0A0R3TLH7_RODNA|nr:unnamed protein product [Rodentolepis nana]
MPPRHMPESDDIVKNILNYLTAHASSAPDIMDIAKHECFVYDTNCFLHHTVEVFRLFIAWYTSDTLIHFIPIKVLDELGHMVKATHDPKYTEPKETDSCPNDSGLWTMESLGTRAEMILDFIFEILQSEPQSRKRNIWILDSFGKIYKSPDPLESLDENFLVSSDSSDTIILTICTKLRETLVDCFKDPRYSKVTLVTDDKFFSMLGNNTGLSIKRVHEIIPDVISTLNHIRPFYSFLASPI